MLIVEIGTGLPDANSYVDVDFADRFFMDRALDNERLAFGSKDPPSLWVGTEHRKEAALIRATDHIDAVYGIHFLSSKKTTTQALAFPRTELEPPIPLELKKATALYAVRALSGPLTPDNGGQGTEQQVTVEGNIVKKREKLGPIEQETQYAASGGSPKIVFFHETVTPKPVPEADMMLQTLLKPGSIKSSTTKLPGQRAGSWGNGIVTR